MSLRFFLQLRCAVRANLNMGKVENNDFLTFCFLSIDSYTKIVVSCGWLCRCRCFYDHIRILLVNVHHQLSRSFRPKQPKHLTSSSPSMLVNINFRTSHTLYMFSFSCVDASLRLSSSSSIFSFILMLVTMSNRAVCVYDGNG